VRTAATEGTVCVVLLLQPASRIAVRMKDEKIFVFAWVLLECGGVIGG